VKKHDVGDVTGLEEVFRSQERSRLAGPATDAPVLPEQRDHSARSAVGAGAFGEALAESPGSRQTSRSWTFASVSALVALVVAGVTAGAVQLRPVLGSAQGQRAAVRPHDGFHTSGPASIGPTAAGSHVGTVASGVLALGEPRVGATTSDNQPQGHVVLSGAATTSGTVSSSPGLSSAGGSATRAAPPLSGASGGAAAAAGPLVAGVVSEVGSATPAPTPVTNVAPGVVNTAEHRVRDSTL
jgi:hypothetical protein